MIEWQNELFDLLLEFKVKNEYIEVYNIIHR